MKKEFNRLSTTNLVVLNSTTTTSRITVDFFEVGRITLTLFAIIQFLKGSFLSLKKEGILNQEDVEELQLYYKLSKCLISNNPENDQEFVLSFAELRILRKWLELRMRHCELERDQENPAFNPDTYIAQKFLLLDLRELMMGEIQ